MDRRQVRWLVGALSGGILAWIAIRRRQALIPSVTTGVDGAESVWRQRILLPWGGTVPEAADETVEDQGNHMTRKVGKNRKISVHGKLYGPLDPQYIGKQVDVTENDSELTVSFEGQTVGTFPLDA